MYQLFVLLSSAYIRHSTNITSIPSVITRICAEYVCASYDGDRWDLESDSDIKLDDNNTKLIVLKSLFFDRRVVRGVDEWCCSRYDTMNRKVWRIRVHRLGKRDFMFKIGIRQCTTFKERRPKQYRASSYMLRVANGSIESSDWILEDGDIISILYHRKFCKFAVNNRQFPIEFQVLPLESAYCLVVELYDCVEVEILGPK